MNNFYMTLEVGVIVEADNENEAVKKAIDQAENGFSTLEYAVLENIRLSNRE